MWSPFFRPGMFLFSFSVSLFLSVSFCFFLFLSVSFCFSLFLFVSFGFSLFLSIFLYFFKIFCGKCQRSDTYHFGSYPIPAVTSTYYLYTIDSLLTTLTPLHDNNQQLSFKDAPPETPLGQPDLSPNYTILFLLSRGL